MLGKISVKIFFNFCLGLLEYNLSNKVYKVKYILKDGLVILYNSLLFIIKMILFIIILKYLAKLYDVL